MADAAIASMAGLVSLHLAASSLPRRMVTLMACAFGMICVYAVGAFS